jgi:outer membrane protein assembly factor BamB
LATNAEVIRTIKDHRIFFLTKDEIYANLNGLQVLRTATDEVVWKYTDTNHLTQAPIFTKDKIFLRNGDSFSGTAYALDRMSGVLLWSIPDIIGNLAYSPERTLVYALRKNGDLLAIDVNTGKESVVARFSPGPFIFFDGVDTCSYQLAYDEQEHILIVYLGDSKQMFAFKR